jgi:preprotein translocase subunit YajC
MLIQETILAMGPAPGGGQGGSPLPTVLMFAGIFAVMYFMMIRPQQKRQKEQQNMINSLTKGDKVVTGTGIHGKIVELDEKTVVLDIANNVHVRFEKAAISQKVS